MRGRVMDVVDMVIAAGVTDGRRSLGAPYSAACTHPLVATSQVFCETISYITAAKQVRHIVCEPSVKTKHRQAPFHVKCYPLVSSAVDKGLFVFIVRSTLSLALHV
jgi:hypothetical protein